MAENFIVYTNQLWKGEPIHYYTEATTPEDILRLRKATGYALLDVDTQLSLELITKKIKYVRLIEKQLRRKKKIKAAASFYDAIVVLGGDDFAETYYHLPKDNLAIKNVLNELSFFHRKTKLFMVGQTIGPYTGKRLLWARETFKPLTIYTRDQKTTDYMSEVLGKNVSTSRDLAFLPLYLEDEYKSQKDELLEKWGLKKDHYITIVGTGLIGQYTPNLDDFVTSFYQLLQTLKKAYPQDQLVFLSHVTSAQADRYLYDQINIKYQNYAKENCIAFLMPMLPVEARLILGGGWVTITCRMHAAVSTFEMGKPAVCLSYSPKYQGVIADGLHQEALVINAKGADFWKSSFDQIVLEKLMMIQANKKLNEEIENAVFQCQTKAHQMIEEIVEKLK